MIFHTVHLMQKVQPFTSANRGSHAVHQVSVASASARLRSNSHKVFREVDAVSLFSQRLPHLDRVRRNAKPKHAGASSGYHHPKMVSSLQFFLERHNCNMRCQVGSTRLYGLRRRHHRKSAGLQRDKVAARMAAEDRGTKKIQAVVCFIRHYLAVRMILYRRSESRK
jgi:hypothetical protein